MISALTLSVDGRKRARACLIMNHSFTRGIRAEKPSPKQLLADHLGLLNERGSGCGGGGFNRTLLIAAEIGAKTEGAAAVAIVRLATCDSHASRGEVRVITASNRLIERTADCSQCTY